jgi:hypothetical protein
MYLAVMLLVPPAVHGSSGSTGKLARVVGGRCTQLQRHTNRSSPSSARPVCTCEQLLCLVVKILRLDLQQLHAHAGVGCPSCLWYARGMPFYWLLMWLRHVTLFNSCPFLEV